MKGARYLAINENRRLPTLEDPNTGVVAWEFGAVINYMLRVYDKSGKLGPPENAKREVTEQTKVDFDKWSLFLLTTLSPMTGQTNWYTHCNPVSNPDALERYSAQTYRTYDVLEGQLKKSDGASVLSGGFCG